MGVDRRTLLRTALIAVAGTACGQTRSRPGGGPTPTGTTPPGSGPDVSPSPRPARVPTAAAPTPPSDGGAPQPSDPSDPPGTREATAAAVAALPLLCRDAWGASAPGEGGREHRISGLMVHHSAVALDDNRRVPQRLRSYQDHHRSQGWPDIAYHLNVDRYGHLYELRDPAIAGDTFTDYDPAGWLLVLADGNFDQHPPTEEQLEGIAALLAWGVGRFGVGSDTIAGHRDRAATSCPGDHLYRHVADGSLRARVEVLLERGGVELQRVCGDDGERLVTEITSGPA